MLADRCYARAPGIVHVASAGGTVAVRVNTRALEFVRFVIVFTTFPEADFSAAEVLEWCWARWQVELVFKRFKTWPNAVTCPNTTTTAPGHGSTEALHVALTEVINVIRPPDGLARMIRDWPQIPRALAEPPRKRLNQLAVRSE